MSKDIKKALEHCVDWDCGNCPNRDELGSGETVCRGRLLPEILEYISDLQHRLEVADKALEFAVNNISWCPAKQGECNCQEHNKDCSWFLKRKAEKELK